MCDHIIYTYSSLKELNRIYDENKALVRVAISEKEFENIVRTEGGYIINITLWMQLVNANESFVFNLTSCLINLDDSNKIIVDEKYADFTLMNFRSIFSKKEPFYPDESPKHDHRLTRYTLYTYNQNELDYLLNYFSKNGLRLYYLEEACKYQDIEFDKNEEILIEITPEISALSESKNVLYLLSRGLSKLNSAVFIAEENVAKNTIKELSLYFEKIDSIYSKFDLSKPIKSGPNKNEKVCRFVDYNRSQINSFEKYFDKDLIGQENFKQSLYRGLNNFRILNKIGDKKIYSVFLFGPSGVGKTEVGRLMSKWLCSSSEISKINFGNYSSKDALNSLIGSPAGYIGYKEGELSKKLLKSKAGVVIFDEFEKADHPIYNFFLELLEDGLYTDSSGTVYDLDGYVFVFTSNILTENEFYNKLPSELISRFDLVCHFNLLSEIDKKHFIDQLVNKYISQLHNKIIENNIEINEAKKMINEVPYSDFDNLRDIKRLVLNNLSRLVERFDNNDN